MQLVHWGAQGTKINTATVGYCHWHFPNNTAVDNANANIACVAGVTVNALVPGYAARGVIYAKKVL